MNDTIARDPGDGFPWFKALELSAGDWPGGAPAGFAGASDLLDGWSAWINAMPPGPRSLHVTGEVMVANPGVIAMVTMRGPQGHDPSVLVLDVSLYQQPGQWLQIVTVAPARFDRPLPGGPIPYQTVEVYLHGAKLAQIDHIPVVS